MRRAFLAVSTVAALSALTLASLYIFVSPESSYQTQQTAKSPTRTGEPDVLSSLFVDGDQGVVENTTAGTHVTPSTSGVCSGAYPAPWMAEALPCCDNEEQAAERWPRHARSMRPAPVILDAFTIDAQHSKIAFQISPFAAPDAMQNKSIEPICALFTRLELGFSAEYRGSGPMDVPLRVDCDPAVLHDEYDEEPVPGIGFSLYHCQFQLMITCPVPDYFRRSLGRGIAISATLIKHPAPPSIVLTSDEERYQPIELCPHRYYPLLPASPTPRRSATPRSLALCTTVNPGYASEAVRVADFVAYHILMGVEHVFIYMTSRRGASYEAYAERMSGLVDAGLVTLVPWPYSPRGFQLEITHLGAYDNCAWRAKSQFEWVLMAQADEYFQPLGRYRDIKQVLSLPKYKNVRSVSFLEYSWFNASLKEKRFVGEAAKGCTHCRIEPFRVLDHTLYPSGVLMPYQGHGDFAHVEACGSEGCEFEPEQAFNASGCLIAHVSDNFIRSAARTDRYRHAFYAGVHVPDLGFGAEFTNRIPVPQGQALVDPFTEVRQNHFTGHAHNDFVERTTRLNAPRRMVEGDRSVVAMQPCVNMLLRGFEDEGHPPLPAGPARTAAAKRCKEERWVAVGFAGCGPVTERHPKRPN